MRTTVKDVVAGTLDAVKNKGCYCTGKYFCFFKCISRSDSDSEDETESKNEDVESVKEHDHPRHDKHHHPKR